MAGRVSCPQAPWLTVLDELTAVLSALPHEQMSDGARLLDDRDRRWFLCGQGRSGLVAQMAAMRLMHVGFTAHVVGEATAPAVVRGDGLIAISATGADPDDPSRRSARPRPRRARPGRDRPGRL